MTVTHYVRGHSMCVDFKPMAYILKKKDPDKK